MTLQNSFNRVIAATLLSVSAISLTAQADINPSEVNAWLRAFDANPKAQMNAPIKKVRNHPNKPLKPLFTAEQISSGKFIEAKNKRRPQAGRIAYKQDDQVEDLVDNSRNSIVRKLEDMSAYQSAQLESQPWSDSYWPLNAGTLAWRYADSAHTPTETNYDKTLKYVLEDKFAADALKNASSLDDLSVAEKYDIL
ncbi:MAG: hypothetical protein EOP09_11275, partial [Proteobacteria bacterium]